MSRLIFLKRNTYPLLAAISFAGIASSSYIYYRSLSPATSKRTFDLPVQMRDSTTGKRYTELRKMPLISEEEMEKRLRMVVRSGGVVRRVDNQQQYEDGHRGGVARSWKWHTAQVAANMPVEDAWGCAVVERDPPPQSHEKTPASASSPGDLLFFTVLDGHAGPHTSRLLSSTLIPAVGLELSYLMNQPIPTPRKVPAAKASLSLDYLSSWLPGSASQANKTNHVPRYLDQNPLYVSLAIQAAFQKLDAELVSAPVRLMNEALAETRDPQTSTSTATSQSLLRTDPFAQSAVKAALTGSCALLALLDTGARNLYVACTGDSRAVAGYFEAGGSGGEGSWKVEVLSEDQTGRNEGEMKRIQSEHPADESDNVIKRGRVLGGLEPTRAFGDARYKWPRELQERISRLFFSETDALPRSPPANLHTPPYVTAQPVVTYRTDFIPPPRSSDATSKSESKTPAPQMRFLILATDGLWDMISSRDACALVAGHLSGIRGSFPKKDLIERLGVSVSVGAEGVEGKDKAKKAKREEDAAARGETWVFNEENLATHLIRNALGGGDKDRLRQIMSIPPPLARSYRDDTTVTVVWWEEGKEEESREVKAKL